MIKIVSKVHCSFAAQVMAEDLTAIGYSAMVVECWDSNDESLYIIYQAAGSVNLPPNYILMQTEPWCSHWFNPDYHEVIKNAISVWDYSASNMQYYAPHRRLCFLTTPGVKRMPRVPKDIPFLFYGWLDGSPRRTKAIRDFMEKAQAELMIVTNTTGPEMWDLLARTQTVVNISYYDHEDAPKEMYRICEAASFGCVVLTEIGNGYKAILPGEIGDQKPYLTEIMRIIHDKLPL